MFKKTLLILLVLITLSLSGSALIAHPGGHARGFLADEVSTANHAPKNDTSAAAEADHQMLDYYFELFVTLAYACPTSIQPQVTDQAAAIYNHFIKPEESQDSIELIEQTKQTYKQIQGLYPSANMVWDSIGYGQSCEIQPLTLYSGLASYVLVDVRNDTNSDLSLSLLNQPWRTKPTIIPPGQTRSLLASLFVQTDANQAAVELTFANRKENPETRKVSIPVKVSRPATIRGTLIDSQTGKVFPGRVYVEGADNLYRHAKAYAGNKTLSEKKLIQFQPPYHLDYKLPFFYSDGTFEINVPSGLTRITMERGFEHEIVSKEIDLRPGEVRDIKLSSGRAIDMKKLGWISGDTHIHWVKNWWNEDEDIALLAMVQRAEDIRVANNLTLLHHVPPGNRFINPVQFPMGPLPGYCDQEYHIQMAEEYRNEEFYGHLCFLNIKELIEPISTGKFGGPNEPDYPINKTAILNCRSQGGITTEAHSIGPYWCVAIDVSHGLADCLDQFEPVHYYSFLDCGFRLPLGNGSDHPARVVGFARCYVKVEGDFTYEKWIDGIRKGKTFTTSGPLIFLKVNDAEIGDELNLSKGQMINIQAKVFSRHPVGKLQIVSNDGEVIQSINVPGNQAELNFEIPADKSRWFVARCSRNDRYSAIGSPDIAHTSAIYVNVDGKPVFSPQVVKKFIDMGKIYAEAVRTKARFDNDSQQREAVEYIEQGVEKFQQMLERFEETKN